MERERAALWSWSEIWPAFDTASRSHFLNFLCAWGWLWMKVWIYSWKCPAQSKFNKTALFGLCSTMMAVSLNTHAMHFRHYSWLSIINIQIYHYHQWQKADLQSKIAFQTSDTPQHKENIFQHRRKKCPDSRKKINKSVVLSVASLIITSICWSERLQE